MTGFRSVVPTLVIGLVIGLPAEGAAAPQDLTVVEQSSFRPITEAMLGNPDPADWLMWRGGYELSLIHI